MQGEQLPNDEVGSLVWSGVDLFTAEVVDGLFGTKLPTTVCALSPLICSCDYSVYDFALLCHELFFILYMVLLLCHKFFFVSFIIILVLDIIFFVVDELVVSTLSLRTYAWICISFLKNLHLCLLVLLARNGRESLYAKEDGLAYEHEAIASFLLMFFS